MKLFTHLRHLILISFLSILTACSSDSSGGGDNSNLAGNWYGTMEDFSGNMYTLSVSVNSDNSITGIYVNGSSLGVTGTITAESSAIGAKLYNFVLSDFTEGGFYADPSVSYVAYIDEDANFGVLQKDALSLPGYSDTDIAGNWSGYSVEIDSALDITDEYNSLATVLTDGSFTSIDIYGSSTGSFTTYEPSYGRFAGTYDNAYVTGGNVRAFLSVDTLFAATWACWGTWPSNCSFSAWTK